MKTVKKVLVILLIALVIIQFYRPEKNSADYRAVAAFEEDTKVTPKIKAILEKHCYDCHSNVSNYPWYSEVAPVSFWINGHIKEGKEHFNVSDWDRFSLKKKDHKLEELIEEVEHGEMPLKSYSISHGSFTDSEKEQLLNWAKKVREMYAIK